MLPVSGDTSLGQAQFWKTAIGRVRSLITGAGSIPPEMVSDQPAASATGAPASLHAFDVIVPDFASGKHSRVSLVRRPDQTLWVWKRPKDDSAAHQIAFRKAIKRAKAWRELGLSAVEVRWHKDKRSLIVTYVPGVTAFERIQSGSFWAGESHAGERLALAQLIVHAARQRAYVTDLNPKNLVFDGTRWHVIDSGSIQFLESAATTLDAYRHKLLQQWSSRTPAAERTDVEAFFRGLALDHPL
jgi:hypothetical protein